MVVIGAACAAALVLGIVVAVLGFRAPPASPARKRNRIVAERSLLLSGALALASGAVVFAFTGWPVAALVAAIAAGLGPSRWRRRGTEDEVTRIEAVAAWTEMLRDTLAAAAGLEEAIRTTAEAAPAPIRSEVSRLAGRLHRTPLPDALRRFAADLENPAADLVVAALVTAAEREARELVPLLGALARSARTEAEMRRRVEVGRVRIRTAARVVSATLGLFGVGLVVFSRPYLTPYATATGQVVLAVVLAVFAGGWWLLDRMSRIVPPERFFASDEVA